MLVVFVILLFKLHENEQLTIYFVFVFCSFLSFFYSSEITIFQSIILDFDDNHMKIKGMDPSWRHIIPPAQQRVESEGHCTDDCTKKSFPPQGISMFAVIMQTHNIGKEIKLRQVCTIYVY